MTCSVLPPKTCQAPRSVGKLLWHKFVHGGIGLEVLISRQQARAKVHLEAQREDLVGCVSLVRQEEFIEHARRVRPSVLSQEAIGQTNE